MLAADINLETLRPHWEAAVMQLSVEPPLADIARRRRGRLDMLPGTQAIWLGRQVCVLRFSAQLFGVISPATRPQAARWATAAKAADHNDGSAGPLSPYLAESLGDVDSGAAQLLLAVDLANLFTEESLRAVAEKGEALHGIAPDVSAPILASIRGVKFAVTATDSLAGRVELDFAADAAPLAAVAKPLVLKSLAKAGAMLPEALEWTPEAGPHSLALKGELTPEGMRRMFSLLALDAAALEPDGSAAEPDEATSTTVAADAGKQAMGKASLRYFRGIGKYVEDLDRLRRAGSLDQAAMWIENYARKIDALPSKNIDPDLAQYGAYVAGTFRSIVDDATGLADQLDAANSEPVVANYHIGLLPTARTVNYGGDFQRMYAPYGYAEVDAEATSQSIEQAGQQAVQGLERAKQSLEQIVADHQTVRTKLTERYGIKF